MLYLPLSRPNMTALVLLASCLLMSACGGASGASQGPTSTPTSTPVSTPTSTLPAASPTTTMSSQATTCLPDAYGLYAEQMDYVTSLNAFNLPAPPRTKHGIGDSGTNANGTFGGDPGMCTIGTGASIDAFYHTQLASLGWSHSTPPTSLTQKCTASEPFWAGVQWWQGNGLFSWTVSGDAGGGSVFWSYAFCMAS